MPDGYAGGGTEWPTVGPRRGWAPATRPTAAYAATRLSPWPGNWRKANEVAARYDGKIAGAYLLLHYPSFGQGIDQNGAKLDNVYLAQRILDKLEAASGVAIGDVPSELAPGQDPNQTAWRLEVQGSAGGQQQGFVDRLRYLDSLKVRGMLLPPLTVRCSRRAACPQARDAEGGPFVQR